MRPSLATPPLFAALEPAGRVLLAGAGGGFDVYAGLPLALALWDRGVEVHLANLSFAPLELVPPERWLEPNVAAVTPDVARQVSYFPELALVHWLAERGCRRPCMPCVAPGCSRCVPGTGISFPRWVWTRSF